MLFHDDLDVDFAILPSNGLQAMLESDLPAEVVHMLQRGWRILLDRDGHLSRLKEMRLPAVTARHPSQTEFHEVVADFLYHALWAHRKLARGELWTAKACSDSHMKWLLIRMLEWHARATHGRDYDTWHSGRFLELWAEPRFVNALTTAFAHYDRADIARSLLATTDLFSQSAHEVAALLQLKVPVDAEQHIYDLLWA